MEDHRGQHLRAGRYRVCVRCTPCDTCVALRPGPQVHGLMPFCSRPMLDQPLYAWGGRCTWIWVLGWWHWQQLVHGSCARGLMVRRPSSDDVLCLWLPWTFVLPILPIPLHAHAFFLAQLKLGWGWRALAIKTHAEGRGFGLGCGLWAVYPCLCAGCGVRGAGCTYGGCSHQ